MKDKGKSWKYTRVVEDFGQKTYFKSIKDGAGEEIKIYKHENTILTSISTIAKRDELTEKEVYLKHYENIFRDTNAQSSIRQRVLEAVDEGEFFSIEYTPKSGKNKNKLTTVYYKGQNCDQLAWLRDIAFKKGRRIVRQSKLGTYWEGFPLNNLTKEGGVRFPKGKKPEALIKRVLDLCTDENDLVMDSFLGSGTTAAVAHKMRRRYIGVEMGEQAVTHVLPRLQLVINGDNTGISDDVDWNGGGGFNYFTLGSPVFNELGFLNSDVKFNDLASYVWWLETKTPLQSNKHDTPFLGVHNEVAYYLLYNGVLGDTRPRGGNLLTHKVLKYLDENYAYDGKRIIIGEATRIGDSSLEALNIEFKQIPYALYGTQANKD